MPLVVMLVGRLDGLVVAGQLVGLWVELVGQVLFEFAAQVGLVAVVL